jgi:hypothetical protein
MKLVRWSFQNLHVPMMEDGQGELYCTSRGLCGALNILEDTLRHVYTRHKEEFDSLSVTDCHAKEFLQENRAEFGVTRVKKDMRLWTEDDMLNFAFYTKSGVARQFRQDLRKFIKANASRHYISMEQYHKLEQELQEKADHAVSLELKLADLSEVKRELHELKEFVMTNVEVVQKNASQFGRGLNSQKKTKAFRTSLLTIAR